MGRNDGYGYQDYELVAGETHGVRAFNVDKLGRLGSVYHTHHVWKPGVNVAKCGSCDPSKIPGMRCSCGFYAFFDAERSDYESPSRLVGVVRMTGRTILGDDGLRAEKGEVVALYVPGYGGVKARKTKSKRKRRLPWMAYAGMYRDGFIPWMIHSTVASLSLVGAIVTLATGGPVGWLVALGVLFVLNVLASVALLVDNKSGAANPTRKSSNAAREAMKQLTPLVIRNYPDVKIYGSRQEMVAAYPMASDLVSRVPDPESDPSFWTRRVS